MKTQFRYLFILPLALAFSVPKANAQTLIQYWDFNNIRPISGLGFGDVAGSQDSLGTAYSYANNLATDTTTGVTWPLYANYYASTLNPGTILYSRPSIEYGSAGRDSGLDGNGPGGSYIFDYSGNSSYFSASDSGFAEGNAFLKTRNPSDSCTFTLTIPTMGYKNIMLQYAISASSSKGAMYNIFSYSTNGGTSWNNLTTAMDTFNIGGVRYPDTLLATNPTTTTSAWYPVQIDFSSDANANNNNNFMVRFLLTGGYSVGGSGNDRYDNFAVWGTPTSAGINEISAEAAGYNVYPNPVSDFVNVISEHFTGAKEITLYDVVGQKISTTVNSSLKTTLNTSALNTGVYFIEIREVSTGDKYTIKIVKE